MFCMYLILQKEKTQLKFLVGKILSLLINFMKHLRNTSLFGIDNAKLPSVSKLKEFLKACLLFLLYSRIPWWWLLSLAIEHARS